jgi:hypothetical protein
LNRLLSHLPMVSGSNQASRGVCDTVGNAVSDNVQCGDVKKVSVRRKARKQNLGKE